VIIPGGAQNEIARMKDEIRSVFIVYKMRQPVANLLVCNQLSAWEGIVKRFTVG